ncbi:magnesium chelatase subunit H [Methylocapsa palsarum]|uniref:magnesium chelatase n=1 Tax=Methylocapsa palsarum TaxID=1612308 RepID=A0A1I4BCZ8_9HYPH|nr:magnesium chelatase subunit H [Methylocapsa palsarum]SFK66403.1 magnesium chelatase subunit H [Methylocapsa palsarum]
MQNPITAAKTPPVRVVFVTMDTHLASATDRARTTLQREIHGLSLTTHAASEWAADAAALDRCCADIAQGDIVVVAMLFMEEHFKPVLSALTARRGSCDAMVCAMSAGEVTRLTRMGRFSLDAPTSGPLALLKRLRGNKGKSASIGANQMKMLRRLPKLLRFIPGTAQDMRAYFLTLQYFLSGSEENMANMVRFLVDRYADGPRRALRGKLKIPQPAAYPDVGVYHPRMQGRIAEDAAKLPGSVGRGEATIGLLVMRSYVLAGNTGHYDGVIAALEARGLRVIPAFATGLDARPAIERFFFDKGQPAVDVMISLMGFSLVGGPAYNDARAAEEILARLDAPYIAAHPVEFQTIEQWRRSDRGLLPVESTIMIAIPELDGSTGPIVFGGRCEGGGTCVACDRKCSFPKAEGAKDMRVCAERAEALAARVEKLATLRRSQRAARRIAIVLFNFPPNAGNTGTAAFLSVFESLYNILLAMKRAGYSVEAPTSVDDLRARLIEGNSAQFGAIANVHSRIPADAHVRGERWLNEIEAQWGPSPGRQQSDGASIFVLGELFGNVFVGLQPAFGYEGDPMRLLFEKGFAPTHAFSAFYRWLRQDFNAHAALHFGTHGALEFMPGKQCGLSAACWPERLIGDLPNFYLYASNNPSEGAIAKRRSAATLISYLTPPVANAGLYRGLIDLKASLDRWRQLEPEKASERGELEILIQAQAADLDLTAAEPAWAAPAGEKISKLAAVVLELEYTLIPHGLHVVGEAPAIEERIDMLIAVAEAAHEIRLERASVDVLVRTGSADKALAAESAGKSEAVPAKTLDTLRELAAMDKLLAQDQEIPGVLDALDGRYVRPAPGGDLLRTPAVLPTGRNLHGFDPFRIPSAYAVQDGARQAKRLIERHIADNNPVPETVALVLWGTDNLKTEGAPIAQALALLGAKPRFDSYGRLAGATLIPLDELAHPRIDVMISLSGIFRDLLPLQIALLAEAALLAASSDEPSERNFVRKHALAFQAENGCDLETAALRVFGNADGAYGSNVNHLVANGRWEDADELAEAYTRRKGFAYGCKGAPKQEPQLLKSVLASVDLAYQNLDSVELGVTTIDTYFDTLGGVTSAVRRLKGASAPVYIGDQTRGEGIVRTLDEQVALEARTRMLNPKWYEGMLKHGYEGVRQIEAGVTNTMGWSATTGQVDPWVYQKLSQTFVLDPDMRERLSKLNPTASAKIANRLIEAHERSFWSPDEDTLEAMRQAGAELEDRLEGVGLEVAA